MPNLADARRAVELEFQARRAHATKRGKKPRDVSPELAEYAAVLLVDFWEVADKRKLPASHYGRIGYMVRCAVDVALAPKDEEGRAARRADLRARSRYNKQAIQRVRWDTTKRGARAPGVEDVKPNAVDRAVSAWADRPRPGMVTTAPGGARSRVEPKERRRPRRRTLKTERSGAWSRSPDNMRNQHGSRSRSGQ